MDMNKISMIMAIMWFLSAVCFFAAGMLSANCMFSVVGYIQSAVGMFFVYHSLKHKKQCSDTQQ